MHWLLFLALMVVGCADLDPLDSLDTEHNLTNGIEEKSSLCTRRRIACEQECFETYGQTWGTLSPLYNACMDECHQGFMKCTERQRPHRVEPRPGHARTRTYSWDQPDSEGPGGYYGYCGPTAASNLLANMCGYLVPPSRLAECCFGLGPGTNPRALVETLNGLHDCGRWAVCHSDVLDGDPLDTLFEQLPAAALLDWDGALELHWVTVVDVHRTGGSCQVVYNHWGRQDRMGCNEFIERWSLTPTSLGGASIAARILTPFTYVCQISD